MVLRAIERPSNCWPHCNFTVSFAQAILRRTSTPNEVITDKHPAYPRAIRQQVPQARPIQTGRHHASGPPGLPIERSPAPVNDRTRPMRGLQRVRTGQFIAEGIEVTGTLRRGDLGINTRQDLDWVGLRERAHLVRTAFDALAVRLRSAA